MVKDIFLVYIAEKKKVGKMSIVRPIPFNKFPKKNVNFSTFWTSCFYSLERRFLVLEYRKRHFLGLYWIKKKVGKMAIFRPKPWINPFEKMSIFGLFCTSFFFSLERRFLVVEHRKLHFPMLYCLKKEVEKWSFLDQNHGLICLEKCQFFDFSNLLFFWPRKAFLRSRIS